MFFYEVLRVLISTCLLDFYKIILIKQTVLNSLLMRVGEKEQTETNLDKVSEAKDEKVKQIIY